MASTLSGLTRSMYTLSISGNDLTNLPDSPTTSPHPSTGKQPCHATSKKPTSSALRLWDTAGNSSRSPDCIKPRSSPINSQRHTPSTACEHTVNSSRNLRWRTRLMLLPIKSGAVLIMQIICLRWFRVVLAPPVPWVRELLRTNSSIDNFEFYMFGRLMRESTKFIMILMLKMIPVCLYSILLERSCRRTYLKSSKMEYTCLVSFIGR
jgi:hypothetical protein